MRIKKTITSILICFLFLAGTTVWADSGIKQEENVGRINLDPAEAINKTENTWHRFYWDGTNMIDVTYTATLNSAATMTPNVKAHNTETTLKSGYGYTLDVNSTLRASKATAGVPEAEATKALASIQSMNVLFPEFNYEKGVTIKKPKKDGGEEVISGKFNRLGLKVNLNEETNKSTSRMTFKPNEFSANQSPVHFTPFWLPDETTYTPFVEVFDAWTPGGMLGTTIKPTFQIDSQVYDDWHIAPIIKPKD